MTFSRDAEKKHLIKFNIMLKSFCKLEENAFNLTNGIYKKLPLQLLNITFLKSQTSHRYLLSQFLFFTILEILAI